MANLPEDGSTWPAGVYQLETTDPVVGGAPNEGTGDGMSNIPHKQMNDRLAWLKAKVDGSEFWRSADAPSLLGETGYQRLPSGLIIQWGEVDKQAGPTVTAVTLPLTYPTAIFVVLVSEIGPQTQGVAWSDKTVSGFDIHVGDGVINQQISWITTGI